VSETGAERVVVAADRGPSRETLRALLDRSSQLLCMWNPETGHLRWWNASFQKALGMRPGEPAGYTIDELVHPEDATVVSAETRAATEGPGEGRRFTARIRSADSDWRVVAWVTKFDAGRRAVFAAGRDVTDARAVEEALRAAEVRLQAVLAHAPAAIFVEDLGGRTLLANAEWERVRHTAPGDLDALKAIAASTGSAVADLSFGSGEDATDYMVALSLLREEDGSPFALCGIATDITERKRVEAALLARQAVLDTVLRASPDIISLMDREGKIHQISAAEEAMLGLHHTAPEDRELFQLVHPDDFDEVASAFIRMVTGAVSRLHVRYRIRHADGHWLSVDSRGQAVVDENGHFLGAVVVSRDISDRLESEQRLESLRQAAEQASRAKSEFLSRMSHELRTPLNSILGFSQLLQMDELGVQQADAVDHILRAGRHLLDLIDEVLDIARIESGHLELSIVPVRLLDVAADAVDLTRPMADRADVAVRITTDRRGAPAVLADRQRLLQVLLNLVSNAVKYNRTGGHVDISCEAVGEGRVRLAVADTGRGIRAEDLGRVFAPFDRLGAEQSGVEGTGVGLSLSRYLVEQMHGSLGVESVPDLGTTFFVELPEGFRAERPEPDQVERRATAGAGAVPGGGNAPRFLVLLVEPNLTSLELVERVLARRPGVVVLGAMHGRLALDLAREHRPDLILLDMHLPDMPGSVLLDRLGEDKGTADIPVAVLGPDSALTQARRVVGRGVAGTVPKPIDVRALLSLVDAVRTASGR
jgi:PAS domain S-box-containing protein